MCENKWIESISILIFNRCSDRYLCLYKCCILIIYYWFDLVICCRTFETANLLHRVEKKQMCVQIWFGFNWTEQNYSLFSRLNANIKCIFILIRKKCVECILKRYLNDCTGVFYPCIWIPFYLFIAGNRFIVVNAVVFL